MRKIIIIWSCALLFGTIHSTFVASTYSLMIFFCCSWMLCMVWPSSISFWNLSIRVCNWSFSCFCCIFKSFSCLPTRPLSRSSWTFFCKTIFELCQTSKQRNEIKTRETAHSKCAYLCYVWMWVPQFSPSTRYSLQVEWKCPIHCCYFDYVGQWCRQADCRYFCLGFSSCRWTLISESVFRFVDLTNPFPRPTKWEFPKCYKINDNCNIYSPTNWSRPNGSVINWTRFVI